MLLKLVQNPENQLDHILTDILPWHWCCKMKNGANCQKYNDRRPTDNGANYESPKLGRANGNGHIGTLDGVDYTFNGAGEFWMLRNSSVGHKTVLVQSRSEIYGAKAKATVFTSFSFFAHSSGQKIQVSLAGANQLAVLVDEFSVDMNDPKLWKQKFVGTTVSRNSDFSRVTLTFAVGFEFVISADNSALSLTAAATVDNYGKVEGLLGKFDGDKLNDLKTTDGQVVHLGSRTNLSQIHYNFGMKWSVNEAESLFVHTESTNKSEFVPILNRPNLVTIPLAVLINCHMSKECLYDYVATEDLQFAVATKLFLEQFNETLYNLTEAQLIPTTTSLTTEEFTTTNTVGDFITTTIDCFSVIAAPVHGSMTYHRGTLRFVCQGDYSLVGAVEIWCQPDGQRSSEPPECVPNYSNNPILMKIYRKTAETIKTFWSNTWSFLTSTPNTS